MPDQIGYDELLQSCVRQLKDIADRLEQISKMSANWRMRAELWHLRCDVARLAQEAEAEHAAF